MSILKSRKALWGLLAVVLVAGALIVVFSPAERTLGQVVKIIYVHVALSRAGAVGFVLAALLGLGVLIRPGDRLTWWMRTLGWAGLILFGTGFVVSGAAQIMSWGGLTLSEPRVAAGANVLAVAIIAQIAGMLLSWPRLAALLHILVAGFQLWSTFNTPNVLHPSGAISSSGSAAIHLANNGLLALAVLLGAWLVWFLWLHRSASPDLSRQNEHIIGV